MPGTVLQRTGMSKTRDMKVVQQLIQKFRNQPGFGIDMRREIRCECKTNIEAIFVTNYPQGIKKEGCEMGPCSGWLYGRVGVSAAKCSKGPKHQGRERNHTL